MEQKTTVFFVKIMSMNSRTDIIFGDPVTKILKLRYQAFLEFCKKGKTKAYLITM